MEIAEKIKNYLVSERKTYAPSANYAYNCGSPCARSLVYNRLAWDQKALPPPEKILIFREGDLHEKAVIQLLMDAGIEIIETQRPFEIKQIQLRGKIDGRIRWEGKLLPTEIKSMNPYDWEKINTIEDIKTHMKIWIRGYYSQMQMYLFGMNETLGLFLLKNKVTGQLKDIMCPIDFEYAEKDWKKLELVNKHVEEQTYPERVQDRSVCRFCDFRHICLPDEVSDALNISDDPELLQLLERREALAKASAEYDKLDEKIKKDYFKGKPVGDYLVSGKYQVHISSYTRKSYAVPDEVKKQYEEVKPYQKVEITALKGDV
jgi:hypothetical protein